MYAQKTQKKKMEPFVIIHPYWIYLVQIRLCNVQYTAKLTVDDTGIVVHNVELAMPVDGGVDQLGNVVFLRHIAVDIAYVFAEFVGEFLANFVLDIGDYDFCSIFMKNSHCTSSNPACTARDDRHLPFQSEKSDIALLIIEPFFLSVIFVLFIYLFC